MESSKQHKDQPKDNLLSQSLHASSRSNQSLREDRTDVEQTAFDQAEHHFEAWLGFRRFENLLFDIHTQRHVRDDRVGKTAAVIDA